MLLQGGRRKDGVCEDSWWLEIKGEDSKGVGAGEAGLLRAPPSVAPPLPAPSPPFPLMSNDVESFRHPNQGSQSAADTSLPDIPSIFNTESAVTAAVGLKSDGSGLGGSNHPFIFDQTTLLESTQPTYPLSSLNSPGFQVNAFASKMEVLRQSRLGLPPSPSTSAVSVDEADKAARRAWQGLKDLGERSGVRAGGMNTETSVSESLSGQMGKGSGLPWDQQLESAQVAAGRRYVASLPSDRVPLGYLQLVLDDIRALRATRQRAAALKAYQKLQSPIIKTGNGDHHLADGMIGGDVGRGGQEGMEYLLSHIQDMSRGSSTNPMTFRAEELRLGDVEPLLAEYAELVSVFG